MTDTHVHDGLEDLIVNGLDAVHAATEAGKEATGKIRPEATHPALQAELDKGMTMTSAWGERVAQVRNQVGATKEADGGVVGSIASATNKLFGASDNHIIMAIYKTGKETTEHAKDDISRDLGIITTGQLALHYYIAAFGSLANYLRHAGHADAAAMMKQCAEEAKAEDERHTQLAEQVLGQG